MSSSLHEHSSTTALVPSPQAQEVDVVVESSSMPAFHPPPSEVSTPLRTSSFDLQALTESMQTPTTEHREEVFKRLLARIAELERQRDATILKAAHSPDPACGSADIGVALSFEFERLKNWGQKLWDKVAANDEFDMNMAAYEPLLPGAAGDYGDIDYTTAVDDEHQTAAAAAVSTLRSPLQAVAAESARALNELRGAMARAHHAEQEVERLKVQLLALEQAMIEIKAEKAHTSAQANEQENLLRTERDNLISEREILKDQLAEQAAAAAALASPVAKEARAKDAKIQALEEQLDRLTEQHAETKREHEAAVEALSASQEEAAKHTLTAIDATETENKMREEQAKLQAALEQERARGEQSKIEIESLQEKSTALLSEIQVFKTEMQAQKEAHEAELAAKGEEATSTVSALEARLAVMQAEGDSAAVAMNTEAQAAISKLEEASKEKTSKIAEMEQRFGEAETAHANTLAEKETAHTAAVQELKSEHTSALQEVETAHAAALQEKEQVHATAVQELNQGHGATIEQINNTHAAAVQELKSEHNSALQEKETAHAASLQEVETAHAATLQEKEQVHATAVQELKQEHGATIEQLNSVHATTVEELKQEHGATIEQINNTHAAAVQELKSEHNSALQEKETAHAASLQEVETAHAAALQEKEQVHATAVQELKQEHGATIEQLNSVHATTVEELSQANKDAEAERDAALTSAAEAETARAASQAEATSLTEQLAAAREEILRVEAAAASLQKKFSDSHAEKRKLQDQLMELRGNVRVFARARPLNKKESVVSSKSALVFPAVDEPASMFDAPSDPGMLKLVVPPKKAVNAKLASEGQARTHCFDFDMAFAGSMGQEEVWSETEPFIASSLYHGRNVCVFAYGQTGSGKTYTMEYLSARTFDFIFGALEEQSVAGYEKAGKPALEEQSQDEDDEDVLVEPTPVRARKATPAFEVYVSMLEIYNESIHDLLVDQPSEEEKKKSANSWDEKPKASEIGNALDVKLVEGLGWSVPGLTERRIGEIDEVEDMFATAKRNRSTACTNLNSHSSRSHMVMCVRLVGEGGQRRLNLVDLAGSERVGKSGVKGAELKEAQSINKSLSALGDVISGLRSKKTHVPYRNSKLTMLLQDSLGGQSKVLMFAHVSPGVESVHESLSTLQFASRARATALKEQPGSGKESRVPLSSRTNAISA
ncbi:kinesin motor domain-containing protein [Pseudoscourfieldia marina]